MTANSFLRDNIYYEVGKLISIMVGDIRSPLSIIGLPNIDMMLLQQILGLDRVQILERHYAAAEELLRSLYD